MKTELIQTLIEGFVQKAHRTEDVEFWFARDLQKLLGYSEWRNFTLVIDKGREACRKAGNDVPDHFVDVNKMIGDVIPCFAAGFPPFIDHQREVAPLGIAQQLLKIAGEPEFDIFGPVRLLYKAFDERLDQFCFHGSITYPTIPFRIFLKRSSSRFCSRSLIASRLSYWRLPSASASSTFAHPFLK